MDCVADTWLACACGNRHWGALGAAGLYLWRQAGDGTQYLGQLRPPRPPAPSLWGLPGGARQVAESALAAALREAREEADIAAAHLRVWATRTLTHPGPAHHTWTYTTVVAEQTGPQRPVARTEESLDLAWLSPGAEPGPLLPALAAIHPELQALTRRVVLVIDAANVVGSRPDGWWRDRAGAAARLLADCATVLGTGLSAATLQLPGGHWYPDIDVVLEGAARPAAPDGIVTAPRGAHLTAVCAPAAGDDEIVAQVARRRAAGYQVLLATADKGLAARARALGAQVLSPRVLPRPRRDS